jgi:putative ATP-dependent endonuclease of OLD family
LYLARVQAENFRIFGGPGAKDDAGSALDVALEPGLTVLVGENDSGKSALIDAIRLCLPSSADNARVTVDDFHRGPTGTAEDLQLSCTFKGLSDSEIGTFADYLTTRQGEDSCLELVLQASRQDPQRPHRVAVTMSAGGRAVQGEVRELLRATYLRPLRDAEAAMSSGRNSRLSQILANYPSMQAEKDSDFDAKTDKAKTLVGIMERAEHHIDNNPLVNQARDEINNDFLSKFAIGGDNLASKISIASSASLLRVLERLELSFAPSAGHAEPTRHGLGYDNALFMAAELLLLGAKDASPLLLIEEPEAHMHPQLQSRVVDLLSDNAGGDQPVQTIVSTHSPHIASSVPVAQQIIVAHGRTYALRPGQTKLDASDYAFLSRFLDVTKANLFFARAVAIVEGDAEVLLLPALAKTLGRSFSRGGVSIVNVGHVGLFRYARIFQRKGGPEIPVRVACITDMDLAPDAADDDMRKKLKRWSELDGQERSARVAKKCARDGGPVKTFVSGRWTLEYDLALASWTMAVIMHQAITAAAESDWPSEQDLAAIDEAAAKEVKDWESAGESLEDAALRIYRPLRVDGVSKAIAAQHAVRLLETASGITANDLPAYLVEAITYLCQDSGS